MIPIKHIDSASPLPLYYCGPPLEDGPRPTFIYFATSGVKSLSIDPYCQPVHFLDLTRIRAISFDLPGHSEGGNHQKAMSIWSAELLKDPDYIENFLKAGVDVVDFLVTAQIADPKHIAIGGLSRGGYVASQLAARHSSIGSLVGFSPLISFDYLEEFKILGSELLGRLDNRKIVPQLVQKRLNFLIGNHDTRVGTEVCIDFIQRLTTAAINEGVRSPQVELTLFPSVGHRGHGTPPEIFHAGANWLMRRLTSSWPKA
jgi:esterase FrsA